MRLVMLLSCFVLSAAVAQPVYSPPAELLAPVTYDFDRPGPPPRLEDTWEELTRGTNLALGAPYRFDRKPNYGVTCDAGDVTQLTDGKLVAGNTIWFSKEAVGYMGADPAATVCLDLGRSEPIRSVVVRVQGGGAHEGSFRYPLRFDILVSDDDRTYHLVDSVMKREYLDQRGAFYALPEAEGNFPPGNPRPHAFNFGNLNSRGRYVAVRMAFAGPYNALDEIAVIKGDHHPAAVKFDPKFATTLNFTGVDLLYPRDWLQVPLGAAAGFSLAVRDARAQTAGPVTYRLDLPAAVPLSWSGTASLQSRAHDREGQPYIEYGVTLPGTRDSLRYFYLAPLRASLPAGARMYFHAETPEYVQPEQAVRLLPVEVPVAPRTRQLFFALGWTGLDLQMNWPGSANTLTALGFTHASVGSWEMPSLYRKPETTVGQKWLDETARGAGLGVCLTDSPFHIMEAEWGREPDFAEAYAQVDPPQKRLCLSYRGKYYQKEIARIVERFRYRKPDTIFLDIECFGGVEQHVQACGRCKKLLAERKQPAKQLAADLMTEILTELASALNAVADELKRARPKIGIYHASPAYNYHDVFEFAKLYPAAVQLDNPEVYTRCWPPAVAEIIRTDRARLPAECPIIAWLSPGTLNWEGEVAPGRYFDSLMELFCNGAIGAAYYTPWNLCPGDLVAQSQASWAMAPVEHLLPNAGLCDTKGWVVGDTGSASAVRNGEERLLLVADYRHLGEQEVVVRVPVDGDVEVVDLFTRKSVARLTPVRNELRVRIGGAYRSRVFYVGTKWRAD